MRVLVTGSRGQLGSELQVLAAVMPDLDFFFYDLPELDICSESAVRGVFREHGVEAVVNCAAYTAVDRAESDADRAFAVNRDGAGVLARCAAESGALVVHVSTDYVFDGLGHRPYRVSDPTGPLGVYGRSKLEGEELVRALAPSWMIVRTSWLYSRFGGNFVKTMLRLGAERERIGVVCDQIGSPTWGRDLAAAIVELLRRADRSVAYAATYHYANQGVASWYDVATAVMELGGRGCVVDPVSSEEYPMVAPRPHFSVLDTSALRSDWGLVIPWWYRSLSLMVASPEQPDGAASADGGEG